MLVNYIGLNDDYVVEFGSTYIRFYKNHELIKKADGSVYQLTTPYFGEDIDNIQTIQNGDFLYIFNRKHPIKTLSRYDDTDWKLVDYDIVNGPFDNVNTTENSLKISDTLGLITITSDSSLFNENDVGRLIRITVIDSNSRAWQAEMSVKKGDILFSDGKYYEALADTEKTGNIKPVHTEGTQSDGSISFKYLHAGYGVAKITEYVSSTEVKARVIDRFPDELKTNSSNYWELGLLSKGRENPYSGTFYRNRFCFMVDIDNIPHICMSNSEDYNNFRDKEHGEVLATNSITVKAVSNKRNIGKWVFASDVLFVGTSSGEFTIDSASQAEPLSPDNVKIQQISEIGCSNIRPVNIGSHVIFVTSTKTSIRDIMYSFATDAYDPVEISLYGKHLLSSGIKSMSYQEYPDKVLWFATNDGKLIGLTFSSEQKVSAFHQHYLSGDVESVVSSKYGKSQDLWVEVKRDDVVNIEWLDNGYPLEYIDNTTDFEEREFKEAEFIKNNSFFVDSGVVVEIPQTTLYDGYFYETTKNLLNKDIKIYYQDKEEIYNSSSDVYLRVYGNSNISSLAILEWNVNTSTEDLTYKFVVDKQFIGSRIVVTLFYGSEGYHRVIQDEVLNTTELNIHTDIKMGEGKFRVTIYGGHNEEYNIIDGLSHLEGKTVAIMEDGAEKERAIVKDGKLTIGGRVKKAVIGLPIESVYIPQTLYIQGNNGSGVGDVQRIDHVTLMLWNSLGGKVGKDLKDLDDILYRDEYDLLDNSSPLYTGNKEIPVGLNTSTIKEKGARVVIYNDSVFPMNILAIAPHLITSGNGL